MNCSLFTRLLYEIPLSLWTPVQQASADIHCLSCEGCRGLLQQQQQLFTAFNEMELPESTTEVQLQLEPLPRQDTLLSGSVTHLLAYITASLLCAGSSLQLFRESGFSWYWYADGSRLEAVSVVLYDTPLLSVTLLLLGLVFCFAQTTRASAQ
jgi:hypothetical protein